MTGFKKTKIGLLAVIVSFVFISIGNASAATYYVSPTGSDSNSGTSSAPFKTIQKAANIVNAGDTVIVRDGTYTDTDANDSVVRTTRGGTATNWVTFRSENKWGAVLDCKSNTTGYGWVFSAGSAYVRVEDFEVKGCGWTGFHSNASGVHDIYMYGNKVHDIGRACTTSTMGRSAFFQGIGTYNFTFDSNVIHTIGRLHTDQTCGDPVHWYQHDHGFYVRGTNSTIIDNVMYDITSGWGVQFAPECTNYTVVNNTFYGANPGRDGQVMLWGTTVNSNIFLGNNVFSNPNNYGIVCSVPVSGTAVTAKNNLTSPGIALYKPSGGDDCQGVSFVTASNVIGQDPKFKSATNKDFHLQAGSPAIDRGIDISGYDYDADGNPIVGAPDIGAYEYAGGQTDTIPPTVPAGLAATAASSSQINLSWTASTDNVGISGYKVYRNGSLVATVTKASYSDTGLTASTTYSYKVSAFDGSGNASAQSAAVSATTKAATTDTQAPTVPTGLTAAAVSSSQINLAWTASTDNIGVSGYRIYRNGTQIATTSTTLYTDKTGLTQATTYTYTVAAYDAAGNASTQSFAVIASTPKAPVSVADIIVDNGGSGTSYTGSWAASGASGYYGSNSLWGWKGATYSWHVNLPQTGTYDVYVWWTTYSDRSTSVPITISYNGGSKTINVNQQLNGGKWNYMGTFSFTTAAGGTVMLSAPGTTVTYNADAVKFVYVP